MLPAGRAEFDPWTYAVLFLLVVVEGPIAILLAAAASSAGLMRPGLVFVTGSLGNLTSDWMWYGLGYAGKQEWIHKIGRWMGIRESLLEHLKQKMIAHATQVLFMAKLTISFVIPALIAAGLLRISWKRWFPYFVLSEALWTGALVLIGYYTTAAMTHVARSFEYAFLGASLIFVIFMIIAGRRMLRRFEMDSSENSAP